MPYSLGRVGFGLFKDPFESIVLLLLRYTFILTLTNSKCKCQQNSHTVLRSFLVVQATVCQELEALFGFSVEQRHKIRP